MSNETSPLDVILHRAVDGTPQTNVAHTVTLHSPDGFEWGYAGSGPADLALNILAAFVPPGADGFDTVKCHKGECSTTAFNLHQIFKWQYITPMPHEGGTITEGQIRGFLEEFGWLG